MKNETMAPSAPQVQEGAPIYQVAAIFPDSKQIKHWYDTTKGIYDDHHPEYRRLIRTTPVAGEAPAAASTPSAPADLLADIKRLVKLADDVGRSRQSNNYAMNSSAVVKLVDLEASVAARITALATQPAASSGIGAVAPVGKTIDGPEFRHLLVLCGLDIRNEGKLVAHIDARLAAAARTDAPQQAEDADVLLWLCGQAWFQDEAGHRLDLPGNDETVEQFAQDVRNSVRAAIGAPQQAASGIGAGEAAQAQPLVAACTCPSGDGSLRWPCPQHPVRDVAQLIRMRDMARWRAGELRMHGAAGALVKEADDEADELARQIKAAQAQPSVASISPNMYRKTALVQAEQFLPAEGKIPAGVVSDGHGDPRKDARYSFVLHTKEGVHTLRNGDYVCTGPAGEQWNVEQSIFEATYELVAAPTSDQQAGAVALPHTEDDLVSMPQLDAIRATITPGDGWSGDDWEFALANAVAYNVARRFRAQGGNTNNSSQSTAPVTDQAATQQGDA